MTGDGLRIVSQPLQERLGERTSGWCAMSITASCCSGVYSDCGGSQYDPEIAFVVPVAVHLR